MTKTYFESGGSTRTMKELKKTGKCTHCLKEGEIGQTCSDHPDRVYTHQWADLNDVFPLGALEVWYMRPECFRSHGSFGDKPDPKNLEATHILLGKVGSGPSDVIPLTPTDLEDLWVKLQGEFWSPNGEANAMIRALGLRHTSISVGDCFRFANGRVWRAEMMGFEVVR